MKNSKCKNCKHCGAGHWQGSRGLCLSCYRKPLIKELYPVLKDVRPLKRGEDRAQREYGEDRPVPRTPTKAVPGSEEKIKILMQRYSGGYQLWHPRDRTCFPFPDEVEGVEGIKAKEKVRIKKPVRRSPRLRALRHPKAIAKILELRNG